MIFFIAEKKKIIIVVIVNLKCVGWGKKKEKKKGKWGIRSNKITNKLR